MSPNVNPFKRLTLIAFVLLAGLNSQLFAQSTTKVEDFSWIAGDWNGNAMGGSFEESWNAPSGGAMMGMFKFVSDGKINFYEILTIVPKGDSFVLRLKHFDDKLVGWEAQKESVEFPLVSVSPTEAKFDGLTFTLLSDRRMDIVVVTKKGDQVEELRFECHRASAKQSAQSDYAHQIDRILEIDRVLANQRDHLPEKQTLEVAIESYVLGLKGLDLANCPPEFTEAFKVHRDAWNDSTAFFAKYGDIHGEMHHAIDAIRKQDEAAAKELDQVLVPIFESWKEVEKLADRYKHSNQKTSDPSNK